MDGESRNSARLDRRETLEVVGLFLLAVGLRVVYVMGLRDNPYFEHPVLDPGYHAEWARTLARGEAFSEGPFFRAPLYVWFLSGVMAVTGEGLLAPRLVQALLGGATTVLTYLVARQAFDRRTARLSGIGAAVYWVLIYFDGELLIPTLAVPLYMLALWLTLRLGPGSPPLRIVLAGLAWGIGALARPNVLLLLPVYAAWLWWGDGRGARRLRSALLFVAGVLTPIAPITAYNTFVGGDFALISTQAGVNLWIGNNPQSDGHTPWVPGTSGADFEATHTGAIALAEREEGRSLAPSEVSAHYSARARRFWMGDPAAALRLTLHKLGLFWQDGEIGNNQPVRFTAFHEAPWLAWVPLRFTWLAPLALVGLALALLRRGTFPLTSFLFVYTAGVVAFFVCSRFRVPVLPVLIVLAAYALVEGLERWRGGRRRSAVLMGILVLLGSGSSAALAPDRAPAMGAGELFLGQGYQLRGDAELARPHLERAIELDPTASARINYSAFLEETGAPKDALAQARLAMELEPRNPRVLDGYLGLLLRLDRDRELASATARALELAPEQPTVHYHHGAVLARGGKGLQAVAAFEEASRLDPLGSRALAARAGVLAGMGQAREALESATRALEIDGFPNAERQREQTWGLAVRLALELGEVERARRLVGACEAAYPGSSLAAELRARLP